MTIEDNIRAFLLDPERRTLITVNGIEKKAGIPGGNLAKFLAGKRPLPERQINELATLLKVIGFGVVAVSQTGSTSGGSAFGNTLPIFTEPTPVEEPKPNPAQQTATDLFNALAEVAKPNALQEESNERLAYLIEAEENMTTVEKVREHIALREAQERDDHWDWVNMKAEATGRQISQLMATYKKRKMKTALFIRLRVIAPDIERKVTWRCFLELADDTGKLYKGQKWKASPAFCETLFGNKAWKEIQQGNVSFYEKAVGNPVLESTPKVKVKKKKPVATKFIMDELPGRFLLDMIDVDDNTNTLAYL